MDTQLLVESLPLLGVCNLCLSEGAVKSMLLSYKYKENNVTYSEMLLKCFSIDMKLLELGDTKRLICDACISKLQEAVSFRELVEASLRSLEASVKLNKEHLLPVKLEPDIGFDDDITADDDEEDNMDIIIFFDKLFDSFNGNFIQAKKKLVLKDIVIKREPKEEPKRTRRKLVKKESKLNVKTNRLTDTETLLESGLFPFKIRKDRTFSCAICPETSKNLDDIKNHIKDHSKTNLHVAFKKMMFSNSNRFFKNSNTLRCKICTTDLKNYDDLKQHIENCTRIKSSYNWNNLPFKLEKDQLDCPICKKTFLNFVSLNTHMNLHYPNFICENCGKAFASKARLRGHMRTHEIGSFPCRYCNAIFDRVTKRENHVSKEHKSGVRYACKRCNISLSSFYARQKHLAEVHNEELKRYKCKACPQSYITPGHLSSHVRRDHLNERNHQCNKCDLAFYTKNALKMHMIKHDGERIHTCTVCQKSYQRKKTLREHMRIHNNDRRFVCPVCGRAFTQKCTLKGHLKVHERKVEVDDRIMQPLHSI